MLNTSRRAFLLVASLLLVAVAMTSPSRQAAWADPVTEEYQKRLARMNGELAKEHYELGTWCLQKELDRRAQQHFERALVLDPKYADAARKLAELRKSSSGRSRSIECEVRMRNGDHVKGRFLAESVAFETEHGLLDIPATDVLLMKTGGGQSSDRIFSDAFSGEGNLADEGFPIRAKLGDVTVPRTEIDMIRLLHPCDNCRGKRKTKCTECNGTGRIFEKGGCDVCGGKGKVKCDKCGGKGKITCPLCNGQGNFAPPWGGRGRFRRMQCPRCHGSGEVDCPDCEGGWVVCPKCNGKPPGAKARVCDVCGGKKTVDCPVCGGTGSRALPPEAEAVWNAVQEKAENPVPVEGDDQQTDTDEVP